MKTKFRMIMVAVLIIGLAVFLGQTPVLAADYNEAPALRILVAAGELPPVEERLPDEPLVVKASRGEIGVYGGTFTVIPGRMTKMTTEFPISVEVPGLVKPVPNVVKAWEINEDATEVTFFLRKGMKWSDGAPFTADDWMFWYNDIEGNKELSPIRGTWYEISGEHGVLTKIDDYTIKWIFAGTFGSFLDSLSEWPVRDKSQFAPAHYFKQFHVDYASATELEKKMKEGGYDTWMDLFGTMNSKRNNPELPVLGPWVTMNEWGSEIQIWERNPYFWKVDLEGNQLPYVDRIECPRDTGKEANLLRLLAGEFSFCALNDVGGLPNISIVMENQEKANYRAVRSATGVAAFGLGTLFLNVHHKDPAKRELFNTLDFRKALSVALNRQEIIDVTYRGLGIPSQVSPATGPPYHGEDPRFKDYYTQYDPELANQLLDGIGLTERDKEGYRLGPDGKKLLIILQPISGWVPAIPEMADMFKGYFASVGLNSIVRPMPQEPLYELVDALEHDIFIRCFPGGNLQESPANSYLFPRSVGWHTSPLWARWILTNGEDGEEPPEWVKRLAAIDGEAKAEVNMEKRIALYTEAVLLHVNELMPIGCFGVGGDISNLNLYSNDIKNIPSAIDIHWIAASSDIASWYIPEEYQ